MRIGNAASEQFQLDVYGEVMDALYQARRHGIPTRGRGWALQRALLEFLEAHWTRAGRGDLGGPRPAPALHPLQGDGLGRVRPGGARRSSSSGCDGPVERWRAPPRRDPRRGLRRRASTADATRSPSPTARRELDASLLMIPLVGFLPPDDPRVVGTVAAIERELMHDGFVRRYATERAPPSTACRRRGRIPALHVLAGRQPRARRAGATRPASCSSGCSACATTSACSPRSTTRAPARLVGNFPQAFSATSPGQHRAEPRPRAGRPPPAYPAPPGVRATAIRQRFVDSRKYLRGRNCLEVLRS